MLSAHHDFETRSTADLTKIGVFVYALDPNTWPWCMSWRVGDTGPVSRWHPGDPDPTPLLDHIEQGGRTVAHNAAFERIIWNWLVRRRICPHWPELRITQQSCTMARAYALALPADLDRLTKVLPVRTTKDLEGAALMKRMMKPRKARKGEDPNIPHWWDEPEKIERLGLYCDQDVQAETEVDLILPELSQLERETWELDQIINERGFRLDMRSVERSLRITAIATAKANARMAELTDGAVNKVTEVAEIVKWINAQGVPCTSIAKGEVDELVLTSETLGDITTKDVIELRREAARASTAKLRTMTICVNDDLRARGQFQYHGAATGRFAGRLTQPHNMPRVDADTEAGCIEIIHDILETSASDEEAHDRIDFTIGPVMPWISKSLRSQIVAEPGNKLVGGDLTNIEGRGGAWLGNEEWKLQAYRDADAKVGPGLYELSYATSFGVDVDKVTKAQRQIGKVQELSLGYQGSVGAYINMAANYLIKPREIAPVVFAATDFERWCRVAQDYGRSPRLGLTEYEWTGIKIVVNGWRAEHPNVVQSWWDVQDAAVAAVASPGMVISVCRDRIRYLSAKGFLWCSLPSGRLIAYARPRLIEGRQAVVCFTEDGDEIDTDRVFANEYVIDRLGQRVLAGELAETGRLKRIVQFEGINQYTRQWGIQYLYGGLQWNNCVQGMCRDILVHGMKLIEGAGYPIVLHVHDEAVAEVLAQFGSKSEFEELLTRHPYWLDEFFPLVAKAWEDVRYVK